MAAHEEPRREMNVSTICNGTVIDHIRNEATFKVAQILKLEHEQNMVLVGMNLPSGKVGTKGIIKVENRRLTPREVDMIALIAPAATLNIIEDYKVKDKRSVHLPERVEGIVKCFNPSCVSNQQAMRTCFDVVGTSPVSLRCVYCERTMTGPDIILK